MDHTISTSFGKERQRTLYNGMHSSKSVRFPVSYEKWEEEARRKLDDGPFYFVKGGAGSEETVRANRKSFERWAIVPRMLTDISERNLTISIFGEKFNYPIMIAPIGAQTILHPEGELATAQAAAKLGVPYIVSTVSSTSMEEIANAMGTAPRWFQLYWNEDPDITKSFINRAEKAGYSALVITLDANVTPWREQDLYNAFLPFLMGSGIENYLTDPVFCEQLEEDPTKNKEAAMKHWSKVFGNPRITWKDIDWIRQQTNLPILLKGILHPDDAKLALKHGVDGIIVSNHGGRQINGSIAALDALPKIADVIQDDIPVLMDSGIRRGSDVLKAMALGAKAVLVGRPYAYGLAVGGEKGVSEVLQNLIADVDLTLALSGRSTISEIDRSLLVKQ